MALTNDQVIKVHAALDALVQADRQQKYTIPKSARISLGRNLSKAIPVIEDYSKQHNALVAKNGHKDKQGQYTIEDQKSKDVFSIERGDLGAQETDVEAFEAVSFADLPEGVPIDLVALMLRTGLLVP